MLDYLFELKNKEFIFACLNLLKEKGLLTDENIKIMTNSDTCHRKFCFQYPILCEVPSVGSISREMFMDATGNRRYYPQPYQINGKRYIVCNDWYNGKIRDNRTPFVDWITRLMR